jgi:hypothetical protein
MTTAGAFRLHVAWTAGMILSAFGIGALSGDLTRVGEWSLLAVPVLLLGAVVTLPLNLAIARILGAPSRTSTFAAAVVLGAGTLAWVAIGWFLLGRGVLPEALASAAWTGVGGVLYGMGVLALSKAGRANHRLAP